jgi:signal peptidase I
VMRRRKIFALGSGSKRTALAGFAAVVTCFGYGLRLARVQGQSMEPTFSPGQWVLVRRLNWPEFPLRDGDVVLLRHDGDVLIKRVAALPGERAPIEDLSLLYFLRPDVARRDPTYSRHVAKLLAPLPAGSIYVLGDNAAVSDDSRMFGPVPTSAVIGRVIRWDLPDPPPSHPIGFAPPKGPRAVARAEPPTSALRGRRHAHPVNN